MNNLPDMIIHIQCYDCKNNNTEGIREERNKALRKLTNMKIESENFNRRIENMQYVTRRAVRESTELRKINKIQEEEIQLYQVERKTFCELLDKKECTVEERKMIFDIMRAY